MRFPYRPFTSERTASRELAYLPIALSASTDSVTPIALLDSGSAVNVLPYTLGLALGLTWEEQSVPIRLTGNLSRLPAYGVIVTGTVESLPPVELAFAWTQANDIPLILGQINFFLEFDVCFFRSQSAFEVSPKVG